MWIDQSLPLFASSAPARAEPRAARAAGLHAFRHHRSIPRRRKPAAPGGAAHGRPLRRVSEVRRPVDDASRPGAPFRRALFRQSVPPSLRRPRARRSSQPMGSLMRCSDRARDHWVGTKPSAFSKTSRVLKSDGVSGDHERKRQGKLPRAQAGSTHREAYFRLGGEAISRSMWNDGYRADSGPSRGDSCRRAFRPIEPSAVPLRDVRFTSIRDVAQTSQMRRYR